MRDMVVIYQCVTCGIIWLCDMVVIYECDTMVINECVWHDGNIRECDMWYMIVWHGGNIWVSHGGNKWGDIRVGLLTYTRDAHVNPMTTFMRRHQNIYEWPEKTKR